MSSSTTFDGPFLAVPMWAVHRIAQDSTPSTLQVLCVLVEHMNLRTKKVSMSLAEIAEASGVSRETAKRCVKWLVEEQVLTVTRASRTKNWYAVMYLKPSQLGSPMTLGRVTHDPSNTPKNSDLAGTLQNSIDNNREISSNENMRRVCDQERNPAVILGSDPHEEPRASVKKTRSKKPTPEVTALAQAFLQHRTSVMRSAYTYNDTAILKRSVRLLLESGLSPVTVRQMIDQFFADTRFSQYKNPVSAFSSRKIQNILLSKISPEVSVDNNVLALLANDFVRDDIDLSWDPDCDDDLRKAITSRAMESVYRYPELVAEIAQRWNGSFTSPEFMKALTSLESLIRSQLGLETADVSDLLKDLDFLHLPQCILSGQPRPAAGTIVEAIYFYRRAANV